MILGITNPSDTNEDNVQVVGYEKIIHHPLFTISSIENDLMLIKLKTTIELNEYVRLVKLPKHVVPVGTTCTVSTWAYNICDSCEFKTYMESVGFNDILSELEQYL